MCSRKLRWLVQVDARGQERRIEKEPDQILHRLVRFVCRRLLLRHDGVLDLKGLLGDHQRSHLVVARRLCFHDALRRIDDSVTHSHLLNLVAAHLLLQLRQWFELVDGLSAAPSACFNGGRSSSSPKPSSSSSMLNPSLIIR